MSGNNIGSLVPEIYYDLIARFSSGIPFVCLLSWVIDNNIFDNFSPTDTKIFMLLLLFGYVAGSLLTTISAALNMLLWCRPMRRLFNNHSKFYDQLPVNEGTPGTFKEMYRRIDLVGRKNRTAGAILVKMEASSAMVDNMLSGYTIIAIAMLIGCTQYKLNLYLGIIIECFLVASAYVKRTLLIHRLDTLYHDLTCSTRLVFGQDSG